MKVFFLILVLLVLVGCVSQDMVIVCVDVVEVLLVILVVGGDCDVYGCIGLVGYQWCEYSQCCECFWELVQVQGLVNIVEVIDVYCVMFVSLVCK